jgi:hypothetical protein
LEALTTNPRIRDFSLQDCQPDQIPHDDLATVLHHTKTLYKHELDAKALAADGSLLSLILSRPDDNEL